MSYKTQWFHRGQVDAIAKQLSSRSKANRVLGVNLEDRDSDGKPCRGAYGANLESKLLAYGFSSREIQQLIETVTAV